ncbi:hypothetical protein EVAR_95269_1 [Eumeta japonica]|uniref:Uncharacterized protein n=1 Tax=Eumeta variegata TaxID=151549 RepID=A0A4C1UL02_EUMVA|nr:hypothetical protein EVAR_95269_1 [Eumeta japonica]
MGAGDFKSTKKPIESYNNRKENIAPPKGQRINVELLKILWLRYISSKPYKIYYNYCNTEDENLARFDMVNKEKEKIKEFWHSYEYRTSMANIY